MSGENGLLAGFAKIDITPDYQVGLGGYSNAETRRSVMVEERIYATCIALTGGEDTILLYTIDNCACDQGMAEGIREAVTAATGIPDEKIFCAATHSHNCPAWYGHPEAEQYRADVRSACVKAAREALDDRAKTQMLAAKQEFPGMNFVRHVLLADGRVTSPGVVVKKDNPPVSYVTKPDSQMVLIKFEREGNKKPILLVNWQGHPDSSTVIGFHSICSSYPGMLRNALSALSGCLVAYFTGADGNMAPESRIPADMHNLNWREYGYKMAGLAYEAMKQLEPVEGAQIATKRFMFEAEIDHTWDHMLEQANEVFDLWKATDKKTGDALGRQYNFSSVYQARAIRTRASMGKSRTLEMNVFRVGDIGFTTGTYEMFSDAGIFIKENSPFAYTFLLTGNSSYIPSASAHQYRCYEADTGLYAPGTAEKLADKYVEMLNEIK